MIEKAQIGKVLDRLSAVEAAMGDSSVIADVKRYRETGRERPALKQLEAAAKRYCKLLDDIDGAKAMLADASLDPELAAEAQKEVESLSDGIPDAEREVLAGLLPPDPLEARNACFEIRAGTGGEEAALFAGDLFRMYSRYCEKKHWKVEVVDFNEGTAGGYKDITFNVTGEKVYGMLKYESGVHRVQRVPATETQGRVHTSAAGVVVLPEAEEFDVELNMADVKKETFCASGPGGQCVNTTYSAVRLTHIPTGIVVSMQDQKSQIKNMEKALSLLRTRLYEREYNKYMEEMSTKRKTMVATGDRSEKVRTYNYPQSRVTDHRIGYTMYNLPAFMDGDIEDLIDALQLAENAEKLKESVG